MRALAPGHPSHRLVANEPRGPRKMKETLRSKCWESVSPHLVNGSLPPGAAKEIMNSLHIEAVSNTVDNFAPNYVLNGIPPLIHPSEQSLPRRTRTILSQLRSGHCARLESYRHRVGRSASDLCPQCQSEPHSSSHLFNCNQFPTSLTTTDLWERPREAAIFLATLPSFNDLPDPGPPPPPRATRRRRPPPEPPPP